MEPNELADTLTRELQALPEQRTAPMRAVRREFTRRIAARPPEYVLALARAILADGKHRWIAYELIADHPAAFQALNRRTLGELGQGISGPSFANTTASLRPASSAR